MAKIAEEFVKNKPMIAAIIAMARMFAKELCLELGASMESIAEQLQVNRTYVYEAQKRLAAHLLPLLKTGPGRPARSGLSCTENARSRNDQLTIDVLRYRAEHPGAVVKHAKHTNYSDTFKYFILNRFDQECEYLTQEEFAKAAEIAVDTLRTWLAHDRAPLWAPLEKPKAEIPVDAPEIVRQIAELYRRGQGSTRQFLRQTAAQLGLTVNQVARVMQIIKLLSVPTRHNFRYRGSTEKLAPGTMLVTDGKELSIHLTGTREHLKLNWQAMIDQNTGTDVGFAITANENAEGVVQALEAALYFMGGQPPAAVLCDNKPCYDDTELNKKIKPICDVIKATPGRSENKAILEGSFSLFERRIGQIRLDDSSKPALIHSALSEIIRTYTATTNHVPRAEFDGKSRVQVLYEYVPDPRQQAKDQAFLKRLRAQHERPFSCRAQSDARSRELLEDAFMRFGLLAKDPNGNLRAFLSEFDPAAIKAAIAIFHARKQRRKIKAQWAHRYLTKLIFNMQEELDLQRCEEELLELNRQQAQNWTREEERLYDQVRNEIPEVKGLCCHLAEKAAESEVPVAAAFWREKLRAVLINAKELIPTVRAHLRRLYWANVNTRLLLINELTELEYGLRAA